VTKKKRPARTRTLRRNLERSQDKLADARRKLLAISPGGSAEQPLEVASAAVIEGRAESVPCPDCEGALRVEEHAAFEHEGALLRKVELACRRCGGPLTLFFRIVSAQPN
jgi:hypothetical protein